VLTPPGQKAWQLGLKGRWERVWATPSTFHTTLEGSVIAAPPGHPDKWLDVQGHAEIQAIDFGIWLLHARPYCQHSHFELEFGGKSISADQDHSWPPPDLFRTVLRGEITPPVGEDNRIELEFSFAETLKVMWSLQFA